MEKKIISFSILFFILNNLPLFHCNDNLRVAYEWKQIDFKFPSDEARSEAIANKSFIQENVIPVGLEVYQSRLFITLPRWKTGVPASLAYIDINGEFFFLKFQLYFILLIFNQNIL